MKKLLYLLVMCSGAGLLSAFVSVDNARTLTYDQSNGTVTATQKVTYAAGLAVTNAPTSANDVARLTDVQGATNSSSQIQVQINAATNRTATLEARTNQWNAAITNGSTGVDITLTGTGNVLGGTIRNTSPLYKLSTNDGSGLTGLVVPVGNVTTNGGAENFVMQIIGGVSTWQSPSGVFGEANVAANLGGAGTYGLAWTKSGVTNQFRSISNSGPISVSTNATEVTIGITQSSGSVDGYLSSIDWATFNGKVSSSRSVGTTAPLTGGGALSGDLTIAMPAATTSVDGYLTAIDWAIFNGKVSSSRTVSTTAPLTGGGALSGNLTIAMPAATASVDGYLTAADYTAFNSYGTNPVSTVRLASDVVLTNGNQTIGGTKTFNNVTVGGTLTLTTALPSSMGGVGTTDRKLNDSGSVRSVDWENRVAYDANGSNSIDYASRILNDVAGVRAVRWGFRFLYDAANVLSLDWTSRTLKDTSGTTVLNWSSSTLAGTWTTDGLNVNGVVGGTFTNQVQNGGTGATNAAGARANLGAGDVTSTSVTTFPTNQIMDVAAGGTLNVLKIRIASGASTANGYLSCFNNTTEVIKLTTSGGLGSIQMGNASFAPGQAYLFSSGEAPIGNTGGPSGWITSAIGKPHIWYAGAQVNPLMMLSNTFLQVGTNATTTAFAPKAHAHIVALPGNCALYAQGGIRILRNTTATNYTLSASDYYIAVKGTTATVQTNFFPTVSSVGASAITNGTVFIIKDAQVSAAATNIVLKSTGSDTFDGAASVTISVNGQGKKATYDGVSNWEMETLDP